MRLRVPRLIRLIVLLMVVSSLITAGRLSTVQAAERAPKCVLFTDATRVGIVPMLLDPRSGQSSEATRDYFATYEYRYEKLDYSPTGRTFVMWVSTMVAERSWLFVGVPGSDAMRKITEVYEGSGGWSPDGNSYAYIDNEHPERVTITDARGNEKRVLPLDIGATRRPVHFAGWSGDSRYVAAMTFIKGRTAAYYFLPVDGLQIPLRMLEAQYDAYTLQTGLSWSPQGNRFAYVDDNEPSQVVIASAEKGIEQQFALPATDDDFVKVPMDWSPDGQHVLLHIGVVDDTHETKNSSFDYWTSTMFGVDGSVGGRIRGINLVEPIYELPQGWWARDGRAWLFRQQSYALGNVDDHIVRYQIDTDSYQPILDHVDGAPLVSGGDWVAVPVWLDGSVNISLMRVDGTPHKSLDLKLNLLSDARWLEDQRSLLYMGRRDGAFAVGILDAETGTVLFELDGLDKGSLVNPRDSVRDRYQPYLSHSAQRLVLKVGAPKHQSLYLVSLANKQSQHILVGDYEIGDVLWSEDDTAVTVIQYDGVMKQSTMHILSADGSTAQQFLLPGQYDVLLGWTWCP